jgi:xanthine dehydrogenase YagR molybdenum-binding subunit
MGQPVPRIEARLKVTGEARYGSDMPVNNPAFGFLLTSSIAKGKITGFDLAEAKAVPGVLEIFTHENTGDLKQLSYSPSGGGLATSIQDFGPKILHDGQIVGMVVADTFEAAREASYKVKISYDRETPSAGFGAAGTTESSVKKPLPKGGDAEKEFGDSEVRLDATYSTPTEHHNAVELFTTTAVWNGDDLTIYEPSQFMYGLKNNAAAKLGIKPDKVRAVSHFVGGAFGSKAQLTPRTGLVALAAKRLNRPVKLVATRDQGFTIATYRAETRHRVRIGANKDGKIKSFQHEGWEVTSRPDSYNVAGVEDSARLYGYGSAKTAVTMVHADRNTPGFMRSPPVVPYIYALESAMDEMAEKLGMDPVEFRRVNDSMQDVTGKQWSSRSLMKCYEEAAKAFGWSKRGAKASMRDGDWLIGYGCASAVYPTHIGASAARVQLNADGNANVQLAAHEIGTGVMTVVGQMAAERLGIPVEQVQVQAGDSIYPPVPVAGGSNQTASCCSVVMKACDALIDKLNAQNGRHGAKLETVGSGGNSLAAKFERLGVSTLEEYAEFVPVDAKPNPVTEVFTNPIKKLYEGTPTLVGGSHSEKLLYAMGAEFVEVRINALTREIRVPRIVGAFAAGRIMNTRTARSQYMGAMIWGISSALHEATEIDPRVARYTNDNLADYMVPVNADVQQLEVILVPEQDNSVNPAGVKGIGELGNVGTAAAVANAVYHATGTRVRELPIRLEKLLQA